MSETTTIQITKQTREELKKIGSMGDDYNKVIEKLIKEHKERQYRLKIDAIAQDAKTHFKEHPEEYIDIDAL
ncbi:MAG: hypothetical protein ACPK85_09380 [Methanosarcina sp.]